MNRILLAAVFAMEISLTSSAAAATSTGVGFREATSQRLSISSLRRRDAPLL